MTTVKTTFDNTHCFGERAPDWKPAEVDFTVIEENGKPVIDDILRPQDGDPGSLKAELAEIARKAPIRRQEVQLRFRLGRLSFLLPPDVAGTRSD